MPRLKLAAISGRIIFSQLSAGRRRHHHHHHLPSFLSRQPDVNRKNFRLRLETSPRPAIHSDICIRNNRGSGGSTDRVMLVLFSPHTRNTWSVLSQTTGTSVRLLVSLRASEQKFAEWPNGAENKPETERTAIIASSFSRRSGNRRTIAAHFAQCGFIMAPALPMIFRHRRERERESVWGSERNWRAAKMALSTLD